MSREVQRYIGGRRHSGHTHVVSRLCRTARPNQARSLRAVPFNPATSVGTSHAVFCSRRVLRKIALSPFILLAEYVMSQLDCARVASCDAQQQARRTFSWHKLKRRHPNPAPIITGNLDISTRGTFSLDSFEDSLPISPFIPSLSGFESTAALSHEPPHSHIGLERQLCSFRTRS